MTKSETLRRLRALVDVDPSLAGDSTTPPIHHLIPGIGGPYYNPNYSPDTPVGKSHSSTQRQLAPFKRGQAERTRRLSRRTRPTPGSVLNRRPRWD